MPSGPWPYQAIYPPPTKGASGKERDDLSMTPKFHEALMSETPFTDQAFVVRKNSGGLLTGAADCASEV